MASQTVPAPDPRATAIATLIRPRIWPAVALVGLYWTARLGAVWAEVPMFKRFVGMMAGCALLLLLFTIWWLFNRRFSWGQRLIAMGALVLGGVGAAFLSAPSHLTMSWLIAWLLNTLPWVFTIWAVWLLIARTMTARARAFGCLAAILLTWGGSTLVRLDGLTGDGELVWHWRWTPTPEDLYLAERAQGKGRPAADSKASSLSLQPGDWPAFRGPDRDGTIRGVRLAADWTSAPPSLLWRRRIGPAWSSITVVAGRLFTQEQRGDSEAVVGLDATTGQEIWSHEDKVRFSDEQAGPGPRATPTFANGRIYALGATGLLSCFDATSGERVWSRNIATDAGVRFPIWGFSSSPLIVNGLVIVYAGEDSDHSLLAYDTASGEPAWRAPAGKISYVSPERVTLRGAEQILFVSDRGLTGYDPTTGVPLWEHEIHSAAGLPWSLQPRVVGDGQVLIASAEAGATLIDISHESDTWKTTTRWTSNALKPSFNDFVVHNGFIYGFDGDRFTCLDLATGKRRWKGGRYGHGQVILLADAARLLVISERGELVLLAANPDRQEELGRIQAVHGKTWNHPTLVGSHLYVRNAEEIACMELSTMARREP